MTYEAGTIELHGPQEYVRIVRTSPVESGAIVLQASYVAGVFPELRAEALTCERLAVSAPGAIISDFWRAWGCFAQQHYDILHLQVALVRLLGHLRPHLVGFRSTEGRHLCPSRVRAVRDLIQDRYAERLTLADISAAVGLSPFHLHRMFTEAMGVPIDTYHRHLRVERALALVRQGSVLADAAAATGFVDQAHLTKTLRSTLGFTPGQYRYRT